MAVKLKRVERKSMEVTEEKDEFKPLICHYCGFIVGIVDSGEKQVRCPSCGKVIMHLGQKC